MSDLQPAWVLSRQSYGDNGLLVELLASDVGRCSGVAKGVFRKKSGGSLAALLQPFNPLLVRLSGRSELKTLALVEAPMPGYLLRGDALLSGLYLNELVARVLPRFDPNPTIFVKYGEAIESLFSGPADVPLRRFELLLLAELGYRIDWAHDEHTDAIAPDSLYYFEVGRGFSRLQANAPEGLARLAVEGSRLQRIARWHEDDLCFDEQGGVQEDQRSFQDDLNWIKILTRAALSQITAGRVLRSSEIFRGIRG